MMDWSDRHCRYFWRSLTRKSRLYTEMITTGALLFGDVDYHLNHDASEHPLAVQLGGNEPFALAQAARLCEKAGYDEVNLNAGCPSERVKSGAFGASLMNQPALVGDCIKAMQDAVSIPVTIKCRIGVDDNDSYAALCEFVASGEQAGCDTFIVHARKAWLSGLSPKQNREIPPLDYPRVFQLKRDFPNLQIILNGGLTSIAACQNALDQLDGVMIGREAYQNPFFLSEIDTQLFNDTARNINLSRRDIAQKMLPYIEQQLAQGTKLSHITRHMLGLCNGLPGARRWRRFLSENAHKADADINTFQRSLELITQ
jgi:tRNA-dihydrouridine synthase A